MSHPPVDHPVLVVEDEPDSVFLLRIAFSKAGIPHRIVGVGTAEDAIDYLTRASNGEIGFSMPSLVLLDLNLPGIPGLEVLRWIKTHPKLLLLMVVIFSSSSEPEDIKKATAGGADCFLQKPLTMGSLVDMAGDIYTIWLSRCSPPRA